MKKSLFSLVLLLALTGSLAAQSGQFVQAPIIVQSGTTSKTAKTLDEAINIAVTGDLIYLPGGDFYISGAINKPVHIYGVGWRNDSAAVTKPTRIYGAINLQSGASGGALNGVYVVDKISHSAGALTDYSISRCRVKTIEFTNEGIPNFHMRISNSVIRFIRLDSGILDVSNTLVEERFYCYTTFGSTHNTTLNIDHCILTHRSSDALFERVLFVHLTNSIIFQQSTLFNSVLGAEFSNSLFVGDPTHASGLNGVQGNIVKDAAFKPSVFVNYPGANYFQESFDFHTLPTCTECADKGIYTGPTPYFDVPENPYVTARGVTVNVNGQTLQFTATVQKGRQH